MKSLLACLGLIALVLLAGCESVRERVQERFATVPPKVRLVGGGSREVFYAAQGTLRQMDFSLARAAEAQGMINAFSRIRSGDGPREARQFTLEIRLVALGPTETEVSVLLREQVEGLLANGATNTPLREHGLYETFFAGLRKVLADKSAPTPERK